MTRVIDGKLAHQAGDGPANTGLRRRRTSVVVGFVVALALVAGGITVLDSYGLFRPQVSMDQFGANPEFVDDAEGHTSPAIDGNKPTSIVRVSFRLSNTGSAQVRVLQIGLSGHGFEFRSGLVGYLHRTRTGFATGGAVLSPAEPYLLAPGEQAMLGVEVRITDCRIVANPDVAVTVDSWRGVQTIVLPLPRLRHEDGGWSQTTADDPDSIGVLRYLADKVCDAEKPR